MTIRDHVEATTEAARERLQEMRFAIETRVPSGIVRTVGTVALGVGLLWGTAWLWERHIRADERARYRAEIAAASPRIRTAVEAGSREAADIDQLVIETIRGTDHALTDAQSNLRHAAESVPLDGCPRIPARCLIGGLQQGASGAGGADRPPAGR